MSFSLIGPFSFGAKVTSAQFNQLDTDHANSLDKSVAGDSILGTITFTGFGHINANNSGAILASTASAIQATAAGAIATTAAGAIVLGGGSTDWVTFSATRSRVIAQTPMPYFLDGTNWSLAIGNVNLVGHATTQAVALRIRQPHNGAKLASVTMSIAVNDPHSGGAPAVLPAFDVIRVNPLTGSGGSLLSSPQSFSPTPANGAAWFDGGIKQTWTATTVSLFTVDTTTFDYYILLVDENGSFSAANNSYPGYAVSYTNIADDRFS